jgi:hypothetical protein
MKKTLLAVVLLSLAAVSAHAAADTTFDSAVRAPEPAQLVTTVKSSATVVTITLASHTATSVIIDTTQMFRWVRVQNKSADCSIFCGENALSLSTQPASAGMGWEIARSSNAVTLPAERFEVPPGKNFYCQNGCSNVTTRATVIRGR